MGEFHVAVAQVNPVLCDIERNVEMHKSWIHQAHQINANTLLFPELSLTGYQLGQDVPNVAMRRDDPMLLDLATHSDAMVSWVGFVEAAGPGEYYNAMAALYKGEVLGIHRKLNVPTYGGLEEGKWFHSGDQIDTFACSDDWKATCLICADMWNPALVHCAMLKRPDMLLAPANSASAIVSKNFSNERNWAVNLQFYAMIYGTPVIMANRYGPEREAHFWGGSRILNPRGEVLAIAEDGEGLVSAVLDKMTISEARFEHPTVRDANTALIQKLLRT